MKQQLQMPIFSDKTSISQNVQTCPRNQAAACIVYGVLLGTLITKHTRRYLQLWMYDSSRLICSFLVLSPCRTPETPLMLSTFYFENATTFSEVAMAPPSQTLFKNSFVGMTLSIAMVSGMYSQLMHTLQNYYYRGGSGKAIF